MSSPTTTTPRRTPKRTTPKRNPLQERSPSQKNEAAGRVVGLQRDSKPDVMDSAIFMTTPFPTKPQHVLLPSTIRKQRSRQNVDTELPDFFFNSSVPDVATSVAGTSRRSNSRMGRKAPNLHLKKSVTALRDMYEAQADSSRPSTAINSRPSTAAPSPALRPTNSRLRSLSSTEGLAGRNAWELLGLPKVSADDLATLPTLSEDVLQRLEINHSFASRVRNNGGTSSPNFRTFGTSSPYLPTFHDLATSSDPVEGSPSFGPDVIAGSSPNLIQLGHSSSDPSSDPTPAMLDADQTESSSNLVQLHHASRFMTSDPFTSFSGNLEETSPNVLKLGTTSPKRSSSPTPSEASTVSRKRKRSDIEGSAYAGSTPLLFGPRKERVHSSSPTRQGNLFSSDASLQSVVQREMPSSPPEVDSVISQSNPTSSPVVRMPPARFSTDRSSIQSAHTNLQSVLSSSPGPLIQRPVVRTPDINQFETLALHKRHASGPSNLESTEEVNLSPVPSVTSIEIQRIAKIDFSDNQSRRISVFSEELDDNLDTASIATAQAYMHEYDLNSSQVNMLSDNDRHEAADELRALPRQHSSFAAVLSHARSTSCRESSSSSSVTQLDSFRTSMDDRLQSMRSFTHGRHDSMRSSFRPGSSGSYADANSVPTWARRYYSGVYRNSFHYLYQSSSNLAQPVTYLAPPSRRASVPSSLQNSASYETISTRTNKSDLRRSWSRSVRSSLRSIVPPVIIPQRPRLNARQSHLTVGIGPLVSNPVRPKSEILSRPPTAKQDRHTIRRVSAPLSAVDPRYHWNGITEEQETHEDTERLEDHDDTGTPKFPTPLIIQRGAFNASTSGYIPPARLTRLTSPHLHQDRGLNTGSEASRGFGAPYNVRPRWQPATTFTDQLGRPSWFKIDVRNMQVICFMAGFLLPITWVIGACMPLPERPMSHKDLEKHTAYARQSQYADSAFDDRDVIARLKLEKHLRGLEEVKWQNARWWRHMNRFFCIVGLIVLIVIIVLAVIGTRGNWA